MSECWKHEKKEKNIYIQFQDITVFAYCSDLEMPQSYMY